MYSNRTCGSFYQTNELNRRERRKKTISRFSRELIQTCPSANTSGIRLVAIIYFWIVRQCLCLCDFLINPVYFHRFDITFNWLVTICWNRFHFDSFFFSSLCSVLMCFPSFFLFVSVSFLLIIIEMQNYWKLIEKILGVVILNLFIAANFINWIWIC